PSLREYDVLAMGTGFTRTQRDPDGTVKRLKDLTPEQERGIFEFVRGGKGFVGIHGTGWWIGGEAVALCGGHANWHPPGLEVTLEEAGYEVIWYELGRDAVDAAARLQPCAVLLDLMLPDIDGQDVLRFLRRDPRTEGIPVVVVSAVSANLTADERAQVQAIL